MYPTTATMIPKNEMSASKHIVFIVYVIRQNKTNRGMER